MHAAGRHVALTAALALTLAWACAPARADAAPTSVNERFAASDGVTLQTTLSGEAPLQPRPTIVEFSPYGRASGTEAAGSAYNHLLVQIRGTGDSDGSFDALGPRTQRDVAEVLGWACDQPWSDGRLGLNGFSASAITVYNSLHLPLPCVKTAVLKSGTHELYRDLLSPGGISNLAAGAGVLGLIGAPALAQGADRLARNPASVPGAISGITGAGLNGLLHNKLDGWWQERGMRGDVNHLPILMIDGFFDVESRGAFQAYQELRDDGAHLVVAGAHDGAPAGTDGGAADLKRWFDRYLLGEENGIEDEPRVKMLLADGDREDYVNGKAVPYEGSDWPIPGTRWVPLALDPKRANSSHISANDGTLALKASDRPSTQSYLSLPSLPTNADLPNIGLLGGAGLDPLFTAVEVLTDMTLSEPQGLVYTTPPLREDVLAAGPLNLHLRLSSSAPETAIWAVVSDVSPNGTPHPVATGRLLSSYPEIDESRSLKDETGEVVQPYGVYDRKTFTRPGQDRRLQVELWPVGNRFKAGHRIRLEVLGASAASLPTLPALNTLRLGGLGPSRLMFPVLPGSDLPQALGG